MAGFYRRAEQLNYDGSYKAGEELANGVFVSITANGVKKLTAAGTTEFRVKEKTTLWGLPAVVLVCTKDGGVEFLVENEFEDYGCGDINYAEYTVPAGHYVKMRRPNINDEIIVSVTSTVLGTLAIDDTVTPASGGSLVKKS